MLEPRGVTGQAGDEFSFRSGRPCLDFAATLMFRTGDPLELLAEPAAVARWARAAGLVDAAVTGPPVPAETAIALRESVYRVALAATTGAPPAPADVEVLNAAAARPPVVPALVPGGGAHRSGTADQVLSTLARDAIDLLGGDEAERIRQCGRDGCTRLFVDRSRGHNRLWCGMRECGNRVNAAAYRARRREEAPSAVTQPEPVQSSG
jgi:predicted RNA-binding Zn ribbon-like protein